jgi:hypothetical protein
MGVESATSVKHRAPPWRTVLGASRYERSECRSTVGTTTRSRRRESDTKDIEEEMEMRRRSGKE